MQPTCEACGKYLDFYDLCGLSKDTFCATCRSYQQQIIQNIAMGNQNNESIKKNRDEYFTRKYGKPTNQ